jgi:DNA invertase Pin-like site-specific DNA recombinase
MAMLIGYARVSKADGSQTSDLQRDALIAAGVEADRIYSAAMGAAKPKSSKQESRRVEIVILAN